MTTREKIEVMEAYERGEIIQYTSINGGFIWSYLCTDDFDFIVSKYRIKPKEKKMVKLETWLFQHNTHKDTYCEITITDVKTVGSWNPIKLLATKEIEL